MRVGIAVVPFVAAIGMVHIAAQEIRCRPTAIRRFNVAIRLWPDGTREPLQPPVPHYPMEVLS